MAYSVGFYNPRFASDMFDVIERNFSDRFNKGEGVAVFPSVDVKETEEAYLLAVDLPGFHEENVDIHLEEQVLTISAKREEGSEGEVSEGTKWLVRERKTGAFIRRFSLPTDVDAENIKADFDAGVLTIHVPRKPKDQGHKIAITPR